MLFRSILDVCVSGVPATVEALRRVGEEDSTDPVESPLTQLDQSAQLNVLSLA